MKRRLDASIVEALLNNSFWTNKVKPDCVKGEVFCAVRNNRIDMYHKGGKLFSFDINGFKTHVKYAAVIQEDDNRYKLESDMAQCTLPNSFEGKYARVKETCSKYSKQESVGVASLYHKHSYLSDEKLCVVDIEVSFKSQDEEKDQDRIDLLLYDKELRILHFVEVKHYSNKEIWSENEPRVVSQIKRYESQIAERKSDILLEYAECMKVYKDVFGVIVPSPLYIDDNVTLLIFGFDKDQLEGRMKEQIHKNSYYKGIKTYSIGGIQRVRLSSLWNAKIL